MGIKNFTQDLFGYNQHTNNQLIEAINSSPKQASAKLFALISHILNSHAIWNSKLIPSVTIPAPWEIREADTWLGVNNTNYKNSILILDKFNHKTPISYTLSSGNSFSNTVEEILFQVIIHSTYHRGQVATEMRQLGMQPLLTDWIVYKMPGGNL